MTRCSTLSNSSSVLAKGLLLVLCLVSLVSALAIDKHQIASQRNRNSETYHISHGTGNYSELVSGHGAVPEREVIKREDNSRFTYYETGLGACGGWNGPTDFIVALNEAQWDGSSHCWDWIIIEYQSKTTKAQIVDECPGCPWGGLDLSPGLFNFLGTLDLGVIYGTWRYATEEPPAPAPAPAPAPTPAPAPPPPPPPPPSPPSPAPTSVPEPQHQDKPQPQPQPKQQDQPQIPPSPVPTPDSPTQTSCTSVSITSTSSSITSATSTLTTSITILQTNPLGLLVPRPPSGATTNTT